MKAEKSFSAQASLGIGLAFVPHSRIPALPRASRFSAQTIHRDV